MYLSKTKKLGGMIALPFSSYIKKINYFKTIDYNKVPLVLVKKQHGILHSRPVLMVVPMLEHRTWSN